MINVIFTFTPTVPLTDNQRASLSQEADWVEIPECNPGTYQAYVDSIGVMESLRSVLSQLGTVKLIGVWNDDGTQYGFEKNIDPVTLIETIVQIEFPLQYPFDKLAYIDSLNDEVTYDENGQEILRTRPLIPKPVNTFAGFNNGNGRDLS